METFEYQTKDGSGYSLTCSERFYRLKDCTDSLKENMSKFDLTAATATVTKFSKKKGSKIILRAKRVENKMIFRTT